MGDGRMEEVKDNYTEKVDTGEAGGDRISVKH